ncbi:hypothetical protein [Tomitella gaofuii]|uniref:hypothetical protein n=1 Tax=Tomitella gaofuii TaxID=2760083 RepID=UPI0015F86810|nr:hypothetical protein [Tomitella gaofuii]
MISPNELVPRNELAGRGPDGIYSLTDNVTPDAFEAAITEARDEGNLSRGPASSSTTPRLSPARAARLAVTYS